MTRKSAWTTFFLSLRASPLKILLVCLLASFVLLALSIDRYGVGYDEFYLYEYAESNLAAIHRAAFGMPYQHLFDYYNLRHYGPAYLILGEILRRASLLVLPGLDQFTFWHLLNFACFLFGAYWIYRLAARLASRWAALLAALLYLTQPLLWGHGVINPKDMPFMVFLLASVSAGLEMWDQAALEASPPGILADLRACWAGLLAWMRSLWGWKWRGWGIGLAGGLTLALVDRLSANAISRPLLAAGLAQAANAPTDSLLGRVFSALARQSDSVALEAYLEKAVSQVNLLEWMLLALAGLAVVVYLLRRAGRVTRLVMWAGFLAGLATSVRVLGPAGMGLVVLYPLLRGGRFRAGYVLLYLLTAAGVSLLLWPYLWQQPVLRFVESLAVMSNFDWGGSVRFEGGDYSAANLPWYYLPKLIGIQVTLPLLGLALAGLGCGLLAARQDRRLRAGILVAVLWFLGPLGYVILARPPTYDNFRQFLFLLPPLFALAGLGFERLSAAIRPAGWRLALAAALLVPGIAAKAWLFPYEYVYYNALVGWTGSVGRAYETDYWATSFCEAARVVNGLAQDKVIVAVQESTLRRIFSRCKAEHVLVTTNPTEWESIALDYSVNWTRFDEDQRYFQNMPVIHSIGRGRTVFALIQQRPEE